MRHVCIFLKLKKFYLYDSNIFSVNSIYSDLDLSVSKYLGLHKKKINIIYSYEDCALNSFKLANQNGIKTIYDLTSPYWRLKKKILEDEIKLQPEWRISSTEILTENKCLNKDEEISLSDQIIVASSFTAKSLELFKKIDKEKIKIIPYGITCSEKENINKREINKKLKLIFVGRPILSKGIQYLIQVLNQIDFPWEIEIAGSIPEKPFEISEKLNFFLKDQRCKFLGQISNQNLLEKMRNSHIFILPSLYEGYGHVLLEAMSCGLPIITTENTGGLDFIKNGVNGFITPIRDVKKTKEILQKIYQDEEYRISVSENSLLTAKDLSWTKYQNALGKIIRI